MQKILIRHHKLVDYMVRGTPALIMLQTLYYKFTGSEESVYIFSRMGVEPWGRYGTGVLELVASACLLYPSLIWLGAGMGITLMCGAVVSHVMVLGIEVQGDGGYLFCLACITLLLCVVTLWYYKKDVPWVHKLGI